MELCRCPKCSKNKVFDQNNQQVSGMWVHPATRRKHWRSSSAQPQDELASLLQRASLQDNENSTTSIPEAKQPDLSKKDAKKTYSTFELTNIIMYFISWLYLICSVSQAQCRIARDILVYVVQVARQTEDGDDFQQSVPLDVRTITKKLKLLPELENYICCPACFTLYFAEDTPEQCTYRRAATVPICDKELFKIHPRKPVAVDFTTHLYKRPKPASTVHPYLGYSVQSFESWISWFLGLNETEEEIGKWADKISSSPPEPIIDILQAPAWKSFSQNRFNNELRLVFSLYVDWFNPFGNKQAGRKASMGAVVLTCLNMPPWLRQTPKYAFMAAILPAPHEPNMTTISHLMAPIVDQLVKLDVGFKVNTHKFPQGRKVSVHLGVLIGDIVATHKVAGHASHSATQPCSWCDVKKDEIEKMRIGKMKNSRNVRMAASAWKELGTLTAKKAHVKKQGVRWSELNRLPYWDPVRSVSLGVMHNWLEGVLKHHWSERWGYHKKKYKIQENEATDDSDSSQGSTVQMDEEEIETWETRMLKHIQVQVAEVVVPQGITRVPLNLGEASHGKIKASEWHALFSIYLPLALTDLLVTNAEEEYSKTRPWLTLLNFAALVQCTNIITRKSVSKKDGETFQQAYEAYTYSSKTVFSNIRINPNHHYALHLPQQMNWWGPPMAIAEFSGERINGLLQSFETNGQLGKIEEIVMRKFCQTQRIKAQDPFADSCQAEDHEAESAKKGIIDMQVYESVLEEITMGFVL
ncbi:hypothetical protein PSTT_10183 [Puccinia striiformis]|uniref:Uncharacterized protein n=1 Tax=Puccinia striiformis TaxID=27350 RepID=A0A2S4V5H6_9BASI|nr:hypothetical protein PSTT_10183 [Puccinia striiformis]